MAVAVLCCEESLQAIMCFWVWHMLSVVSSGSVLTCDITVYGFLVQFGFYGLECDDKVFCEVGPNFPLLSHIKTKRTTSIIYLRIPSRQTHTHTHTNTQTVNAQSPKKQNRWIWGPFCVYVIIWTYKQGLFADGILNTLVVESNMKDDWFFS